MKEVNVNFRKTDRRQAAFGAEWEENTTNVSAQSILIQKLIFQLAGYI